jgi:hypothetical protein
MPPLTPTLTFGKLYSDRANKPLGSDEDKVVESLWVLYTEWWMNDAAAKITELESNVIVDFPLLIGAVGMCVSYGDSKTGCLKLLRGFKRYIGGVGRSGPDHKAIFCFEGDIDGTYILTVPFNPEHLNLTP